MRVEREDNTLTVYCISNTSIIIQLSYLQGSTKYKYHHIYHFKICFQPQITVSEHFQHQFKLYTGTTFTKLVNLMLKHMSNIMRPVYVTTSMTTGD